MLKKKIIGALAAASMLLTMTGCSLFSTTPTSALGTYDFTQMELVQLEEPYEGQPVATIETSLGTITAVLYPNYAPNTVANFIARVNDGFYDGKKIYGVQPGAYFITGASNEEGTAGVTEDGKPIANECSVDLWPFKGAMMAYNGNAGYGDSRFFVVNNVELTDDDVETLRSYKDADGNQKIPEELIQAFIREGSVPHVAGLYTVFGQAIDGLDVVEKLTEVEINSDAMNPIEDIYINKITLSEYKK